MEKKRYKLIYTCDTYKPSIGIHLIDTFDNESLITLIFNVAHTKRNSELMPYEQLFMESLRNEYNRENDFYTETILQYCNK